MRAGVSASAADRPESYALGLIEHLARHVGARRPGSAAERAGAEFISTELLEVGVKARLESFRGPSSFAWAQGAPAAMSLLGLRKLGLALGMMESDLRLEPLSRLASRRPSQNVVAEMLPAGEERRTLVLVSHLDSSRSGIMFHPALAPRLRALNTLISAAVVVRAFGRARRLTAAALAGGLGLLAEREILGTDVPGANDNASGVAVATAFARELADSPLENTRLVFLATGCEESGTVGMRSFLEARRGQWEDWLFLNLDGVGAPATLRFLPREGIGRIFDADPGLVRVCEETARDHPELGLEPATELAGLTYDATPVMARGGRAISISAQDRTIPNYHSAQDVPENLDGDVLARALEATRRIVAAIDGGGADR